MAAEYKWEEIQLQDSPRIPLSPTVSSQCPRKIYKSQSMCLVDVEFRENESGSSSFNELNDCQSGSPISPAVSTSSQCFTFETCSNASSDQNYNDRRGRTGSLVDELLSDIYLSLRKVNRSYSTSSDASFLSSTPEYPFQLKRPLRFNHLKSKGKCISNQV